MDDRVSFKNPPQNTQFPKGQSGNPKGRPKGSKNLKTILLKELETQISIQEKGKVSRVTKQEAFIKSLIAGALKGERAASQILVRLMTGLLSEQGEVVSQEMHEDDMKILQQYLGKEGKDEY